MNDITRHLSNHVGIERFHSQLHNILQHLLNYVEDFDNIFHMVSWPIKTNLSVSVLIIHYVLNMSRTICYHTWICLDQIQTKRQAVRLC